MQKGAKGGGIAEDMPLTEISSILGMHFTSRILLSLGLLKISRGLLGEFGILAPK